MSHSFERDLKTAAHVHIARFERYARELRDDDARRTRRTGIPHSGTVLRPAYWNVDAAFNPYKVRAHAYQISRAITLALLHRDYAPYNPIAYEVPKRGGGKRLVSVFSFADSVVSRRIYKSVLAKNKALLSSYSYAYRNDLTAHDAIQYIGADFRGRGRLFIAEYDFTKYFERISHEYLWRVLDEHGFLLSPLERDILNSFLQTELQECSYARRSSGTLKTHGLPQGTSISLFLANVAAWELDRAMERLGVGFVRYADDTLIWSRDYGRICEAVDVLNTMSGKIGSPINIEKSKGVSIYNPNDAPAEFKAKLAVEFVGYRLSSGGTGLSDAVIQRIKRRAGYIVWSNLLEPLRRGQVVPSRVAPGVDRDYLVMILQLRRYLYGNLSEAKLRRLTTQRARNIRYPGVMSYFPLVNDVQQLMTLDGWLLHTIYTSLRERAALLRSAGITVLPAPHGHSARSLPKAVAATSAGRPLDLRLPSFVRVGTVIRRAADAHGPNSVGKRSGPKSYWY